MFNVKVKEINSVQPQRSFLNKRVFSDGFFITFYTGKIDSITDAAFTLKFNRFYDNLSNGLPYDDIAVAQSIKFQTRYSSNISLKKLK